MQKANNLHVIPEVPEVKEYFSDPHNVPFIPICAPDVPLNWALCKKELHESGLGLQLFLVWLLTFLQLMQYQPHISAIQLTRSKLLSR